MRSTYELVKHLRSALLANDNRWAWAELEHLRDCDSDRHAIWKIVNLCHREPDSGESTSVGPILTAVASKLKQIPNPRQTSLNGNKTSRSTVFAVAWPDLESELLRRVHDAMQSARRVTILNRYEGRLSRMLALFDTEVTPYLPSSLKYSVLRLRLKQTARGKEAYLETHKKPMPPTIFEKLHITMPVNGKVEFAWIETHDPRRWLTTQGMLARERLGDVLLNKWANRLSLEQLKRYDMRTDEQKADQAAMPVVQELADISRGLAVMREVENTYDLKTEIVTAHGAGVSVTSMNAIVAATESRPVAKTANQIVILYPTMFGACLHQHHESPCRAYGSCLPCNNNIVVKGHLPTNEAVRRRGDLLFKSIVNQLDRLAVAHNRGIADLPEGLEAHMLALIADGLSTEEMAAELIDRFHEIKASVKCVAFRNKLEEAFVAQGMTRRFDDKSIASGAIIKYHNPTRHATPGHERAIEAHGGHDLIEARRNDFERRFPQFAPTKLGIHVEFPPIRGDDADTDGDEDEAKAADRGIDD